MAAVTLPARQSSLLAPKVPLCRQQARKYPFWHDSLALSWNLRAGPGQGVERFKTMRQEITCYYPAAITGVCKV